MRRSRSLSDDFANQKLTSVDSASSSSSGEELGPKIKMKLQYNSDHERKSFDAQSFARVCLVEN